MNTSKVGDLGYRVVEGWGKLPPGYRFVECSDVAVDSQDNVYVFCRGEQPLIVFSRDGNFLRAWGGGQFTRPHAITIDPEGALWLVDDAGHAVHKCTAEGKVLLTIGTPGTPAQRQSGRPFNQPTKVGVCPRTGNLYITDGYGNSRVHKYDAAGHYLLSWGEPGTDPGCFNLPHAVIVSADGQTIHVADRENHRIQLFDPQGRYLGQWNNLHRPNGLYIDPHHENSFYVAEGPTGLSINATVPYIGNRVSILSGKGELVGRIAHPFGGEKPGEFIAPHGIAVDSQRAIYVAEVTYSVKGCHESPPREIRSLQKFVRSA